MKRKSILGMFITFLVISILLLIFLLIKNYQNSADIIYCSGNFDMKLKNSLSRGHIIIELHSDRTGLMIYRGHYISKNKEVNFNREIFFSYSNIGKSYVFKSEGIVDFGDKLMGDIDDEHYNLLPAFYKKEGEIYPIDVRRMSDNAFFLYDSMTLTYCSI